MGGDSRHTIDRRPAQIGYIVGVGVVAVVVSSLGLAGILQGWMLVLLVVVCLGPLGLAIFIVASSIALFVTAVPGWAIIGLAAVVSLGVASVNVVSTRQWRARRLIEPDALAPRHFPRGWDQLYGGILFVLAGGAFIVLSIVAGYAAGTAGYNVVASNLADRADEVKFVASVTWWPGLLIAVVGLLWWRVRVGQRRRIFSWGALDLAAMLGLIAAVVHVSR
ncbi:hypothetical protein [Salinibacterium sp. SWN248]|uniref:hypothetical protein n=1 Tax=Salinibacterium sp. SWN248 TaxID=2792056 RepID=UPI0018CF7156|nr:hypothetical protein [Salinibacterium sp. SWN248]MBH0025078.1 hypothetical protein [Salinibacterium sp. SWN248]